MMKSKLIMVILVLGLTACLPTIKDSRAGLGNSDIAKILMTGPTSFNTEELRTRAKHHMMKYCEEKQLSQSLHQCLTQMGMTCEENICRYNGYDTTVITRLTGYNSRREFIRFYTITVDLQKGWDGFDANRKTFMREYN